MSRRIAFNGAVWRYQAEKAAWFFITLPAEAAAELHFTGRRAKSAWGSIRVRAVIGATAWETSVFPDRRSGSFLLPLKAQVRSAESLSEGQEAEVALTFEALL